MIRAARPEAYGVSFWLPTMIKAMGVQSATNVGFRCEGIAFINSGHRDVPGAAGQQVE
jgi:hypothetical protein